MYKVIVQIRAATFYTVKKGHRFSRPQPGWHWPNSLRPGIIKQFPPVESWVSDIPAGDGKIDNFFLQYMNPDSLNPSRQFINKEVWHVRTLTHKHNRDIWSYVNITWNGKELTFVQRVVQISASIYFKPGFLLKRFRQFINNEVRQVRTSTHKYNRDISI